MAKTTVEIVIDANNKATAKIRELGNELDDVSDAAKDAGGAFELFGGALTAAAIIGAGKAAYELAELGAQSLRTGDAFRNISGGAELAEENLEAMRQATRGAMSETEMMARASQMLQMGIATNADELARNAEMAIRLGNAMGTEAGPAMENWNAMIANKSIQRLDTYGISSGNVTKLMGELKEQIEGLSSEEAFRMAVFEEGEKALARLGPVVEDDALAFEKATARAADYRTELAERLAPEVAALVNTGLDLLTWNERMGETFRTHADDVIVTAESYVAYEAELERAAKAAGYIINEEGNLVEIHGALIEANYLAAESVYDATHALDGWTATIGEGYNQAELMRAGLGGIAETAGSTVEEVDKLNEASSRIARSFGEITFDDETLWKMALASGASTEALSQLAVTLGVASDEEIRLALAGQQLMDQLAAGAKTPDEVARAWDMLGAEQWAAGQNATLAATELDAMQLKLAATDETLPSVADGFAELAPTMEEALAQATAMSDETGLINEQMGLLSDEKVPATVDSLNNDLHPSMRLINEDASGIAGSVKNINRELDRLDGRSVSFTVTQNVGGSVPVGRQHGGPVSAGQPYWVGEGGMAELFVPQTSGTIVPGGAVSGPTWHGDLIVQGAGDPDAVARRVEQRLQDRGLIPGVRLR